MLDIYSRIPEDQIRNDGIRIFSQLNLMKVLQPTSAARQSGMSIFTSNGEEHKIQLDDDYEARRSAWENKLNNIFNTNAGAVGEAHRITQAISKVRNTDFHTPHTAVTMDVLRNALDEVHLIH